ncbi:hypothetical protein CFC21_105066 [Triticum aestivum]|uniref:Uncharacterized protein n=3 Tax=Triticum TaxID=4564 RepID=A0A9R1ABU1_TRITD|nr:uncharacterized protein LOC123158276 [Triticum aestivum]KAF7104144.1 hypothetical protein CFC21_105066 [Triticum aestivum]VAI92473.1 unnamed protein product [Triticum turgidum subsp. durum]
MCRGMVDDLRPLGPRRLDVRAFYLRLSSSYSSTSPPPAELTLVYRPAIGGSALELASRALPPACPAEATLLLVRGADDAPAYASADRVSAAEGARFEVYAGKELAAEGAFFPRRRLDGGGWRVECRRPAGSRSRVAEVLVLAEGGVLIRARARAARRIGCATPLEGIPEEDASSWGSCECGACGDEWQMVGDSSSDDDDGDKLKEEELEAETMRWALEMGAWAVCVGVGLLATARRFSRRRAALR